MNETFDKIYEVRWSHTLYKREDQYILAVLCGSVGLFELKVRLTPIEVENYLLNGSTAIDDLAELIQANPSTYTSRNID